MAPSSLNRKGITREAMNPGTGKAIKMNKAVIFKTGFPY
jgi:hypothetical protein